MLVSSFVLLAAGALGVDGSTLDRRAPQTEAVCGSSFSWAGNSKNVSPCQLAAVVSSACVGNTWTVKALPDVHHSYDTPTPINNTDNTCQCSWVAYNLFGACTVCQGFDAAVLSWGAWSLECGDKIPPTPFPKVPLADGMLIPYYATLDPKTWTDQRFNAAQAQPIVREGHSDVSQTNATEKKKTPVGPIVGGVIGGLAALGIAGAIAFWIHSQKKKRTSNPPTAPSTTSDGMTTLGYGSPAGHMRQLSDMSGKSIGTGYQNMGNSFVTSVTNTRGPASPTSMHTHTGSVHSLSYFGSVNNSVAPYATTASPPPVTLASAPSPPPVAHADRENIITPFTLSPAQRATSPNYPQDRKRTDGAIIPVYDSPDSLPNEIGGRQRLNPPAYTDYTADRPLDSASQAPTRPAHTKKGSGDTVTTLTSPISPSSPDSPVTQGTGVNTHISGIDDLLEQMGMGAPTNSGTGGTLATGLSMQVNRSQGPYRPTNPASEPEM